MKRIPGREGLYEISENGIVISRCGVRGSKYGLTLKPSKDKVGYQRMSLYKEGKTRRIYLHRLVYMTYKGNIEHGFEIDHIDGNKSNNDISNLRKVTHKENVQYFNAQFTRRKRPKGISNKGHYKKIVQYDMNMNYISTYDSLKEAKSKLGLGSSISLNLHGKIKQTGGFIFKFYDEIH